MEERQLSLEELQSRMLEMLLEFDDFCTKYHLHYYLAYGTLLGAIRHQGFIPWDDDTDLWMPRDDYEKLLQYSEINSWIKVISHRNQNGCRHPFCYINLIDKKTRMVSKLMGEKSGKGVFVDIFPLDYIPSNKVIAKVLCFRMKLLTKLLWFTEASYENSNKKGIKVFIKNCIIFFMHQINQKKLADKIEFIAAKKRKSNLHLTLYTQTSETIGIDLGTIKSFELVRYGLFEEKRLRIPREAERLLTLEYGNYKKLPPEEERQGHHFTKFYWKNETVIKNGRGIQNNKVN